jgi:glycosyltransferase involved in cell wall biosynthesis
MKKRLAVWTFGGIGTGHFSQGYPVLEQLLNGLSTTFEIVVYTRSCPDEGFSNENFAIRSAPPKVSNSILRWTFLLSYFLFDYTKKKFHISLAFWGWPSGWIATVLGKILGIATAVYVLGADAAGIASINFGIFHRPWLRKIATWTYTQTQLLLAISHYQRVQLNTFGIKRSICVLPWGADASQYTFETKNQNDDVIHFIHVGHLSPVKDQATLLKAFALINKSQPSELHIFGTDCMNGEIQRLGRDLGIEKNVAFLDMVPYHEMPNHYRWADIMLHTSLSEGQSMALTEAAASGVLMAGTPVGLLYDLKDAGGITVDPGDYEALAKKVLYVLKDRVAWNRNIHHARAWSEEHSLEWTTKELAKQLNNLLTELNA